MGRSRLSPAECLHLVGILALGGLSCGVEEIPRPRPAEITAETPPVTPSGTGGTSPSGPAPADGGGQPNPGKPGDSSAPSASAADGGAGAGGGPAPPAAPDAAAAPGVGDGMMIGGAFVPRSKIIVFLHIGHSNMAGRATGPAELKSHFFDTDPRLWSFATGSFRPAREPLAPDMDTGMRAGPGMALLRSALAVAPADAMVVSIGHGHSGTYGGNCANFRRGGLFYDIVMKPALQLKGKVTYAGIFSMFGQSEHRVSASQQNAFADCMNTIAENMRADLGDAEVPFMVGDYERGISRSDIAPANAFGRLLISQMEMIPGKTARSALIPTDGLAMEDDHHFNMAGHKLWAERGIDLLVERGWAPWARR